MKNIFLKYKNIIYFCVLSALIFNFAPNASFAATNQDKYPKIGNYYLQAGTNLTKDTISELAKYDLLVLPSEAQVWNPTIFNELRSLNSDIIILAYVPTVSWNNVWQDSLHQKLGSSIQNNWWLTDAGNNQISIWPGTRALNLSSGWTEFLPNFVHDEILSTGLWSGIFYDEVDPCVVCRNVNVDLDRNGLNDSAQTADLAWRNGYIKLLSKSRELEGENTIIIINGSSTPEYQPYVNGRMFESFPTPWEGQGKWEDTVANYLNLEKTVGASPPIFFIDGDSENKNINNDYRDVRFGITSTLLGGGYFGYDGGTSNHNEIWWYDEYDAYLGRPQTAPINTTSQNNPSILPSVWRRDFEKGIVVLNSTATSQSVSLGGEFEKIHGSQDVVTNDGSIVSRVTLPSYDGLILLRLSDQVLNTSFPNGAFTRIFKNDGQIARTGFFMYDARFPGGKEIILSDLDNNGTIEAIVAGSGKIEIWSEANIRQAVFYPYGNKFSGNVQIALGDTNSDGVLEIVTGAGPGGGPHVKIFNSSGRALTPGFFAYDQNFRGGIYVTATDIDNDGKAEIITGAGRGGPPEVRVFKSDGTILNKGFMAYDSNFKGGINVAAGDIFGNNSKTIVTGANRGGGPHIRLFDKNGTPIGKGFFAYDETRRDGVRVGVSDIDGDGISEILAITTEILP